ncbi:MAG: pilus assembly PilX N-terminal domain-containing protein [Patescibacteria group bacterium]|nr:pilus assembly PilX N-terminal domain-containing protein [Patescibacteria group bacterium]
MNQKTKSANKEKARKGSALLLATILLFVVLSMVVSLTYVTVMEQKMSGKTKSSVGSFFNADSGVEWALNKIANTSSEDTITAALSGITTSDDGSADCPFGGCKVYFLKDDGTVIPKNQFGTLTVSDIKAVRSIGRQTAGGEATQRAIEAAVAASDISFTYYCYDDHPTYGAMGTPLCNDAGGPQGYCPSGYTQKLALGSWGFCGNAGWVHFFLPPGGTCAAAWSSYSFITGRAYVCSK